MFNHLYDHEQPVFSRQLTMYIIAGEQKVEGSPQRASWKELKKKAAETSGDAMDAQRANDLGRQLRPL